MKHHLPFICTVITATALLVGTLGQGVGEVARADDPAAPAPAADRALREALEDLALGNRPAGRRARRFILRHPDARAVLEAAKRAAWEGGVDRAADGVLQALGTVRPRPARGADEVRALLRTAKAAKGEERLEAIAALAECPVDAAVAGALVGFLEHEDPDVIWAAVRALGTAEVSDALVDATVKLLGRTLEAGRDPGDVLALIRDKELDAAAPALVSALESPKAKEHRVGIAQTLEPLVIDAPTLARLVALIPTLELEAARTVLAWLPALHPEADLGPIAAAFGRGDDERRAALLDALAGAESIPAGLEAVVVETARAGRWEGDADQPDVAAIGLLAQSADPRLLAKLAAEASADRDRFLRLARWRRGEADVAFALRRSLDADVARAAAEGVDAERLEATAAAWMSFVAVDDDRGPRVTAAAALALAYAGEPGAAALRELAAGPRAAVRAVALDVLGAIEDPHAGKAARAALAAALEAEQPVGAEAAAVVRQTPVSDAVALLAPLLEDESGDTVAAVARALGSTGDAERAGPPLRAALRAAITSRELRPVPAAPGRSPAPAEAAICAALGALEDAEALEPLALAGMNRDAAMRIASAEALGRIGGTNAARALAEALDDGHPRVREEAAAALAVAFARTDRPVAEAAVGVVATALRRLVDDPLAGLHADHVPEAAQRDPEDEAFGMAAIDHRRNLAAGLRLPAGLALLAVGVGAGDEEAAAAGRAALAEYFAALDAAMERQRGGGWGGMQVVPPAGRFLPEAAVALARGGDRRGLPWLVHFLDRPYLPVSGPGAPGWGPQGFRRASWRLVEALRAVAGDAGPAPGMTFEKFADDPWPTVRSWRLWWRSRER